MKKSGSKFVVNQRGWMVFLFLVIGLFFSCELEEIPDDLGDGTITGLNCSGARQSGTLYKDQMASDVWVRVPYSGGDGGTYGAQEVSSTGVSGLKAKLSAGSLVTGSDSLTYEVSGTPTGAGTASFLLNIGGKSCSISIPVVEASGTITGLNCSGARQSGTLYKDQAASDVWVRVPYSGGNGGTYGALEVNSTGVSGLKAKLSAGSLVTGSDSLTYEVSGTPTGAGTASFSLSVGGKSCSISIPVGTANGTITGLNCSTPSVSGSLVAGVVASGVKVTVAYGGGNGGTHGGQTVSSTGVTGLEAMVSSGSFLTGVGTLEYTITGTPSGVGTASFALSIGGQSCALSLQVSGGSIGNLNCSGASVNGSLMAGSVASGVKVTVAYGGGNGGAYAAQSVESTGVTGLTASLSGSTFANGVGSVEYSISGTPWSSGTANFSLSLGGQSCVLMVPVQAAQGSITSLNCSAAVLSGALMPGVSASGKTLTVPYSGGNGGTYVGQVVNSSGVSGLTASVAGDTFMNGTGSLVYNLNGTPNGSGLASFSLNVGGQSCEVDVQVGVPVGNCGAYVGSGVWKAFSCYNLGAANVSADPFTPSWEINGGYWQWGKNVVAAAGPTGSGSSQANSGSIAGWSSSGAGNGAWLDASKTVNDPCPSGYRVPTKAQWEGVLANNVLTNVGSWSNSITNYSSGKRIGSALFLPAAGLRSFSDGALNNRGYYGGYWSSTESGSPSAWDLYFNSGDADTDGSSRTFGQSVRCIAE